MNEKKFLVSNLSDFTEIIKYLFLKNSDKLYLVLTLQGDLGVGKTTFVKQLGLFLGVKENIGSPTFNILKTYELSNRKFKFNRLLHIDAYRLDNKKDVIPLKLGEEIIREGTVSCIEWPDVLSDILPEKVINLKIKIIPKTEIREITVSGVEY